MSMANYRKWFYKVEMKQYGYIIILAIRCTAVKNSICSAFDKIITQFSRRTIVFIGSAIL